MGKAAGKIPEPKGMQGRRDLCDILREAAARGLKIGYALISPDRRIIEANDLLKKRFGDIEGRPCFEALKGRQNPCPCCRRHPVLKPGACHVYPGISLQSEPGKTVHYDLDIIPLSDFDGIVQAPPSHPVMPVRTRPDAGKKGADAAGRWTGSSRQELTQIIDFLPDPTFAIDTSGRVMVWNKAMEDLTGVPARDMIGKGEYEYAVPLYGRRRPILVDLITGDDRSIREDYTFIRSEGSALVAETSTEINGRRMYLWCKASRIYDSEGRASGAIESIRDITETHAIRRSLRESEARYRDIFENVSDFLYVHDLEGRFIESNMAHKEVYGYSREELENLRIQDLLPEDLRPRFSEFIERILSRGTDEGVFTIVTRTGERRIIEYKDTLLRDSEGNPAAVRGSARDITERKKAEEEHRIYESRLARSQKLEAIGTLAGGIAHDFNNILSAIIGYSELALDETEEGSSLAVCLGEVIRAGDRARDLVSQILAFSRPAQAEKKVIKVGIIVKEALKLLRSSIPTTIAIVHDIDQDAAPVYADPTQIHQVVMNLCTNAYQAMLTHGGTLTLGLSQVEVNDDPAAGNPQPGSGPHLKLTVQDTGCGMDQATMDRIFEPFFTTKEKTRGTGLGLATVHGIVADLKGAVIVKSVVGAGSTFEVYIPAYSGKAFCKEADVPRAALPEGRGERILIVDDERAILEFGRSMLEQMGYTVITCSTSIEALQLFSDDPGSFDLIITDQTMPDLTGSDLAGKMLAVRRDIPIILATGYSEIISREEAMDRGIRIYLEKPFTRKDLAESIRRALDERASFS